MTDEHKKEKISMGRLFMQLIYIKKINLLIV